MRKIKLIMLAIKIKFIHNQKDNSKYIKPITNNIGNVYIPNGYCILIKDNYFYFKDNVLYPIKTKRVLLSWCFENIVCLDKENAAGYKIGPALGFRDGSLIKDISTSYIYFVSSGKKRKVLNPDVITNLGLKESDAILVSQEEAAMHPSGEVIV